MHRYIFFINIFLYKLFFITIFLAHLNMNDIILT